jgi:hypothetical protein
MSIEGEITVILHWNGQRVHHVGLASSRPLAAVRVLHGRAPAEAAALVPRLYALCGQAQGAACAAALRAAAGRDGETEGPPEASAGAVVLEALQETLWRLLIDAPRSLSLPPQAAALAPVRAAVAQAIAAFKAHPVDNWPALAQAAGTLAEAAREQVYGEPPAAWLARTDPAGFDAWRDTAATLPARALARLAATAPGLCHSDTALMPGLDDAAWWSAVVPALQQDPLFAHAPTWGGRPVETGALARWQAQPLVAALIAREGHSAATRFAARLVELATLLVGMARGDGNAHGWIRNWTLADGSGLAAVQTARGLLIHHARLAQGRIADYRIVAPTEWNFHPQGALFRGIVGSDAPDEATLAARTGLAVHALDPCVGFRVEVVRHA